MSRSTMRVTRSLRHDQMGLIYGYKTVGTKYITIWSGVIQTCLFFRVGYFHDVCTVHIEHKDVVK